MPTQRSPSVGLAICLVGVIFLAVSANSAASAERPRLAIAVAVDLSGSWLKEANRAINERVLERVGEAVVSASRREAGATSIRYLKIGASSFFQEPLCDATFRQRLLTSRKSPDGLFTNVKSLQEYLTEDCIRHILSRPEEGFTDIQGALFTAQKLSEGVGRKAIVLLSDMKEERAPGTVSPTLTLDGVNVIIIYRVLNEDRSNPAVLEKRLSGWKSLLMEAGANVVMMPDLDIKAERIEAELLR